MSDDAPTLDDVKAVLLDPDATVEEVEAASAAIRERLAVGMAEAGQKAAEPTRH